MRRVFKTKHFARWVRKTDLTDDALCGAVREMERGLIDAVLGGGVVKKRVALPGRGKSSGARTLVATNHGAHWFFIFGYAKNERANVSPTELEGFKSLAADLLRHSMADLDAHVKTNALEEICHGNEKKIN